MNAATWFDIKFILAEALDQRPERRIDYVERVCAGKLRDEVRALLQAAGDEDDFLEVPATLPPDPAAVARQPTDWIGQRACGFRVERLLACGGMDRVFLGAAEDGSGRTAAIKVITDGADAATHAQRFDHEHHILARMRHPSIVRNFGTGTVGNDRCLVMEHVEGHPIDRHCALYRLGLDQRIALFLHACGALAYVHSQQVVHRDLKPANLLVTSMGMPKLLDFGIALTFEQAATPDSRETAGAMAAPYTAFSPECAAPEQLRNDPVTPSCDVYALGVMLYRLLSGRLPHRLHRDMSILERLRAICHDDPPRASEAVRHAGVCTDEGLPPARELAQRLEGSLDRVLMRALARDPRQRYRSVGCLTRDLRAACAERRPWR